MVYTSYFANIDELKKRGIACISIARYKPKGIYIPELLSLAPSSELLYRYRAEHDERYYTDEFNKQLERLKFEYVCSDIMVLSNDATNVALLCYEQPGCFCHRHLVTKWFSDNGLKCTEFVDYMFDKKG